MSHIHVVPKESADPSLLPLYEKLEKATGSMPNFFAALAQSPEILTTFFAFNRAVAGGKLDPKLRELAYLKASEANGCEYCSSHHRKSGLAAGLSQKQIDDVKHFESSDVFSPLEREVMSFAENVTRRLRDSDLQTEKLHQQLGDRGLLELTVTIGLANLTNRLNLALGITLP